MTDGAAERRPTVAPAMPGANGRTPSGDEPADSLQDSDDPRQLRREILDLVTRYVSASRSQEKPFRPGTSVVRYAGRVDDEAEVTNLVSAALDFWLTAGQGSGAAFEGGPGGVS